MKDFKRGTIMSVVVSLALLAGCAAEPPVIPTDQATSAEGVVESNAPETSAAPAGITVDNGALALVCESPRPQICTMIYDPVCGTADDGSQATYASGCVACSDARVVSHIPGACPGENTR